MSWTSLAYCIIIVVKDSSLDVAICDTVIVHIVTVYHHIIYMQYILICEMRLYLSLWQHWQDLRQLRETVQIMYKRI